MVLFTGAEAGFVEGQSAFQQEREFERDGVLCFMSLTQRFMEPPSNVRVGKLKDGFSDPMAGRVAHVGQGGPAGLDDFSLSGHHEKNIGERFENGADMGISFGNFQAVLERLLFHLGPFFFYLPKVRVHFSDEISPENAHLSRPLPKKFFILGFQ